MRSLRFSGAIVSLSGYGLQATGGSLGLLVTPLRRVHVLPDQMFLVQRRRLTDSIEFPRRYVREVLVVAQRFAVGGLAFLAEMAAAGLRAMQRVEREQFAELEVVGDATRIVERLVHVRLFSRH